MRWRIIFLTFFLRLSLVISGTSRLELTTNGPVYYKAPLAITAHYKEASPEWFTWIFMAQLPTGPFIRRFREGHTAVLNETFDLEETQVGEFTMTVRATYTPYIYPETYAYGEIKFVLTNKIPVVVEFMQNGTKLIPENGQLLVSSSDIVNATTRVNDPSGYFQRAGIQMTVRWMLNNDVRVKNASYAQRYPSSTDRVQDTLQMFMTADYTNETYIADGSVSTVIEARDPVLSLNITDKLWFRRGNLTYLNFKCNGSTPIYYCYMNPSIAMNTSDYNCTGFTRRDVCQFEITRYFGAVGDHEVMVFVRNAVNDILHWDDFKSVYTVHIYNVPTKGLLRLFIVPISCVILGTIVAVSGYALYEHTKGDIRVEVANFDFGGNSTREELDATLVERTFWTHLRDELAESSPIFHWLTWERPQPLADCVGDNKDEDELMLDA